MSTIDTRREAQQQMLPKPRGRVKSPRLRRFGKVRPLSAGEALFDDGRHPPPGMFRAD